MNRSRTLFLLVALAIGVPPAGADLGPLEPLADLHRAVHESLGMPEPTIVRLLERGLPEPELPAVGWIARETGASLDRVAELRMSGMPLLDVALRLGGTPAIFYVPFERDPGPPYGRAWGYYKKTPRDRWGSIRLADAEVIQLSHLKLVTRHYHVSPAHVLELERKGKGYASIHQELAVEQGKPVKGAKAAQTVPPGQAKQKNPKSAKPPKSDKPNGGG
jgi:hypothetical protein